MSWSLLKKKKKKTDYCSLLMIPIGGNIGNLSHTLERVSAI